MEAGQQPPSGEASGTGGAITRLSLETVLDNASDGFVVLDEDWRITYINAAGAALIAPLHGARENLVGRNHWDLFPDLVGSELDGLYKDVAATQVARTLELHYPPLKTWFDIRAYPNDGGISVYFADVGARRRAEQRLEAEKNLLALVASGSPLREVLDNLCRKVELQSDDGMLCSVLLLDDDGMHLRYGGGPSLSQAYNDAIDGVAIGPDVWTCGVAAHLGKLVLSEDLEADPHWAPFIHLARAEGLRACCSRPIMSSKGVILGTIAMYYREPTRPGAGDEALVQFAAKIAGIAIERHRADSALQAAEERLRATFSQAAVGIAIADLDGRFLEANVRFQALMGRDEDELRGMDFQELTYPDDREETAQRVRALLAGELQDYEMEKRYVCKDGRVFWSRTNVTLLRDAQGEPRQFIGAVQDITAHRQAATELEVREAGLRVLADTMPHLVWMAEGDGHIFWYNRRWYEYTGATEDEMRGPDGWHPMHDPVVLPKVLERWRKSLHSGEPFEMEFPLRGADGAYRTFLTRAIPVRDEDGKILRWFGTNTDLEAVDQARRALKDESRLLDLIHRTGQALVSRLDLDGVLQKVTDAATELSGARFGAFFYSTTNEEGDVYLLYTLSGAPREAFEKFGHPRATALFGPTFRGEPTIRIDDVTADPRYGTMGPHHGMPPGHLPVRSYLAVPVVSRSGEVLGGLFFGHPEPGVFTERTERLIAGITAQAAVAIDNARLYEAVKRGGEEREQLLAAEHAARLQAEQASTMKDEFLSTLSHELRTPLSAILGWAQILQKGEAKPEDAAAGIDAIARNARAQAKLIEDLLDMSRIVSGKVRLDVQATDLGVVVDGAVESVRPSADAKGIRLRSMVDPLAGPVTGDPNRLQQVVWNLLSNAVKFTPKGGRVELAVSRVDSHIEIRVSDSGVGIDPEFLPYVFDRFRQADSSIGRAHGGLGLGLAIVRQLTELHGGTVHVESQGPGTGAAFVVCLPLSARRDYAVADAVATSAPLPGAQGFDLSGTTVLVVDDEGDTREVIRQLLQLHGASVVTAANADEALEHLRRAPPDALVSDIGMPGTDGYALIREVRRLPPEEGGRVPALALTAFARSQDRTMALMAGYQGHVAKPFEAHELLATLGSLVHRL